MQIRYYKKYAKKKKKPKMNYFLEKKIGKGFTISCSMLGKRGEKIFPTFGMWSTQLLSLFDLLDS